MQEKGKGEGQVTLKISILIKQRNDGAITGGKQYLEEYEETLRVRSLQGFQSRDK